MQETIENKEDSMAQVKAHFLDNSVKDAKKEIEKIKKYYARGENPHFLLGALIGKLEEILP